MGLIHIITFMLLCLFGISYIAKLIILSKKNNIKANVFGKGKKPKETLIIEKSLRAVTFIGIGIWIVDACFAKFADKWFILVYESAIIRYLGLAITFIGVLFFILAMVFMKTSWRVGVDNSTKTELITFGVYKFSRNPAFVGMDLMFIGTAFTFTNLITIAITFLIVVALHLQIKQEEKHMKKMFGTDYTEYAVKTPRYLLVKGKTRKISLFPII